MTSPIPTPARIAAETDTLQLLGRCGTCAVRTQFIPFQPEWLQQQSVACSVQITAATLLHRTQDLNTIQSIANWLKQVAHELEASVLQEQIHRTRVLADKQTYAARRATPRIEVDANIMAAIEALESLLNGTEATK